eukprot:gene18881-38002_t
MSDGEVFPVPEAWAKKAHMTAAAYDAAVLRVDADPNGYWSDIGHRLDWMTPFTEVKDVSFNKQDFRVRWYGDGVLNVSVNCLDRHLKSNGDTVALIWENDDGSAHDKLTYRQLHAEVCRWANVLKARGVRKGDRVTIYLPMIPAAAAAMLACSRIGAVHSVVFGGFSPDSIAGRIQDCDSKIVITANEGLRPQARPPACDTVGGMRKREREEKKENHRHPPKGTTAAPAPASSSRRPSHPWSAARWKSGRPPSRRWREPGRAGHCPRLPAA